ncbi:MAG: DUF1795 domain-containing protein [Ruminococcaceae bacterium]|nr:DUF1795 domain-containing protein [Oscillospiraceae bacterium]
MKKFIALVLALMLCTLLLSSCGDREEVPKGMLLASVSGEPFKLYVPEQMTVNTESGISSAFAYVPEKMIISARYFTPSADMTLAEYIDYCAQGYASSLASFELKSRDAAVLAGLDAIKMTYTAKIDDTDYTCTQISVLHKGDMVSLNFYIPTESVENHASTITSVSDVFVLCDRAEHGGDEFVDKKTPDGMKIASHKNLEYRFYVPKNWICDSESGRSEAFYSESERSNVTVTSYSPDTATSLGDYIASIKESYAASISGYELIEEKGDIFVAGRSAISLTFKANYDGVEYHIKQVVVLYSDMFYSITYTATANNFGLHIEDVDRMISVFTFR